MFSVLGLQVRDKAPCVRLCVSRRMSLFVFGPVLRACRRDLFTLYKSVK